MGTIETVIRQTVSQLLRDGCLNRAGLNMVNSKYFGEWVDETAAHAVVAINRIGREAADQEQRTT